MSRYDFPGILPDTSVAIGWDRPLRTFFVQVTRIAPTSDHCDSDADGDDATDETRVILWVGTAIGELPYAAAAIRIARTHATLSPDIGRTLAFDRLRTSADEDGPAQRAARPFLSDED